ncbi:hypothetical protein ABCR94_38190 [Streptomyces sp. 21So2-11]
MMVTATQTEITNETALSTLRQVVAERPEHVYSPPEYMRSGPDDNSCFYVHKDVDGSIVDSGCVVGVALHRLGVPLEALVKYEGLPARAVLHRIAPRLSDRTNEQFNDMQIRQDAGDAWGLAYAKATGEHI